MPYHPVNLLLRHPGVEQFTDAGAHAVDRIRIALLTEVRRDETAFRHSGYIVEKLLTILPFELRISTSRPPEPRQIALLHKRAEVDPLPNLVARQLPDQ